MNSPFSEGRYEYDAKHCYFLPQRCLAALEQHKPVYLIGSRGSGKTTLLMSLNWRERVTNPTLVRQVDGEPFRGLYIGTYIKLPKIQLRLFDKWLHDEDDDVHGLLVGRYLDLVFVETMSSAVAELLADQYIHVPSTIEATAVSEWLEEFSAELPGVDFASTASVASFQSGVRSVRKALEVCAQRRVPASDCLSHFSVDQIGTWSCAVSKRLADLCNHDTRDQQGSWHFKVCMDEGECLSAFQQRVVNTLVRLAEWPLFPVVSYVSYPPDITTTLIPHLTHQKADRELVVLDSMEHAEFADFAQGVATVRCQEILQRPSVTFDARSILGGLNLNQLLNRLLDRSEGSKAAAFRESARSFAEATGFVGDELPIYQAYLSERLDLENAAAVDRKAERHQGSQQYRKKMVAAFLSICQELKVRNVPYASADMVFGISDNCVRDFLSQLDHIFRRFGGTLEEFLSATVDPDTQARAIREASEEKRDSMPGSGVLSPVEAGRIVRGLATVTAEIQGSSGDGRHLRSPERGRFRLVPQDQSNMEVQAAFELIRDAADAGFLRVFAKDDVLYFRVHASLAPAYGFSYRGAYYPVPLTLREFTELRNAKNDKEVDHAARAIVTGMPSAPEQRSLFPSEEISDE